MDSVSTPTYPGSAVRHFGTFAETRRELRHVLDSAYAGRVTTVRRDHEQFVVLEAQRVVEQLMRLRPASAVVAVEGGRWSAVLPGLPVHGEGDTLDEALDDLVAALREYAEDWNERLQAAPNHRGNFDVALIGELASDKQLKGWLLVGVPRPASTNR